MKKILSVLIALISVISIAFAFGGCEEEEIETGYFYELNYAHFMGYITHDEAMSIAYYHNGGVNFSEDSTDEDFTPVPKTPKRLSKKTEKSIKQTYLNLNYDGKDYAGLSDVSIDGYYGTYNGNVAVKVSDNYSNFAKRGWTESFYGVSICYSDSNRIYIWKKADDPVKVRGKFYTMEQAYVNGWLNKGDLKSIACSYYDGSYEENPYSGMYTSTGELTEEMDAEIKQAFLEQIVESSKSHRENVSIVHNYGTYNGNIVVWLNCKGVCIDYASTKAFNIGGVSFKNFWDGKCQVYHINQTDENQTNEQPIDAGGQFFNLEEAYNKGYLSEDNLKGIARDFYFNYHNFFDENPYRGVFGSTATLTDKIEAELKRAYLEQVVGLAEGDINKVEIIQYYGFYNDNFIVSIVSSYFQYDFNQLMCTKEIGGVIFKNLYWDGEFFVYHLN